MNFYEETTKPNKTKQKTMNRSTYILYYTCIHMNAAWIEAS